MLSRWRVHPIVWPTLAAYLIFAFASCSGGHASSRSFKQYDALPFTDAFTFDAPPDQVYRAALDAVQARGGVVTISDPHTGLVTAEISTSDLLPEDAYGAQADRPSNSSGDTALAILGLVVAVILFIFLFGWLSDGCSGCASSPSSPPPAPPVPDPVKANKYIISLSLASRTGRSTEVHVSAMRQSIENGTVTSTLRLQNKYLNYGLRDAIRASLAR